MAERMNVARGWLILAIAAGTAIAAGVIFHAMHDREPVYPGKGVTRKAMLSDYAPVLKGTPADTPVYLLEGAQPGPTLLLFGGTHPQEISGMVSAVVVVENVQMKRGRMIVIPHSNQSGFTYTEPLEAFPHEFEIPTASGARHFRLGMRLSNPIHQWPDPDLYTHYPSGEPLIGSDPAGSDSKPAATARYTTPVAPSARVVGWSGGRAGTPIPRARAARMMSASAADQPRAQVSMTTW